MCSPLLAVALLARDGASTRSSHRGDRIRRGIVLFCGSLYALALGGPRVVGVITPFGGVAFVVGWIALAVHAWTDRR